MAARTRKKETNDHGEQASRIEARSTPESPVIYEIVRRIGDDEMARPAVSLWWSGVAAGLSISFSVLAEALLRKELPQAPWRHLVTSLGFPIGFLMVVLGRQQLFTENTITVVLPVTAEPTAARFSSAARMWAIVLVANLAGAFCAAAFCTFVPVIDEGTRAAMLDVSREIMAHPWLEMGLRGITSGFLMAAMVWMIAGAASGQLAIVYLMTYLIGAGGFAHIVTGSVNALLLVLAGDMTVPQMLLGFALPVLAGNIVGGTALFALLSYAQVMKEI